MWLGRVLSRSRQNVSSRRKLGRASLPIIERLEVRINFGNPNLNTDQVPDTVTNCGCPPSTADLVTSTAGDTGAPTNTTEAPVRDVDGMPNVESTDLLSDGFGKSFGIVRSWTGLNESSQVGNGWMINGLPYLVVGRNDDPERHTGRIIVMNSGSRQLTFDLHGETADSMYYEHQRLAYKAPWTDGDGNHPGEFSLTDTDGNVTTFYDLPRASDGHVNGNDGYTQQVTSPVGMNPYRYGAFKSFVDAGGNEIDTQYDSNGNLTALIRANTAGVSERYYFEYQTLSNSEGGTATMISRISLQHRASASSPWTDVRWADYDYYTGDGTDAAYGRLGDLRHVSIFEPKTITSITRIDNIATVTLPNHGYKTGDLVTIKGAAQPEYNGQFTVTVTDANTFTYRASGSPASPATADSGGVISAGRVIDGKFYRYYKFHTDSYIGLHSDQNDPTKSGGTDTTIAGPSNYVNYDVAISGLRTVVEDDAFARLSADKGTVAQFTSDSAADIDPYAQHTFQYERYDLTNEVQNFESQVTRYRVIQETAQGEGCSSCSAGQGTYRISYFSHGSGDLLTTSTLAGPNRWVMRTTETLPDDTNTAPTRNLNPGDMTAEDDLGFQVTVQWQANDFVAGERVTVTGADQAACNGTFAITSVNADSFTYNTTDDPGSGTITGTINVTNIDHAWADNDQNIVYTNVAGEVMMSVLVDRNGTSSTDDDKTYVTYNQYDDDGRLILTANPSAVATVYDPNDPTAFEQYPDLVDWNGSSYANLKSNDGLVETRDYYNTTAWVFDNTNDFFAERTGVAISANGEFSRPAPEGTHAGFFAGDDYMQQDIAGWQPGTYSITFSANLGGQDLQFYIDGSSTPFYTLPGATTSTFDDYTTASFTIATAGTHTLKIVSANGSPDGMTYIDNVRINGTGAPQPWDAGFEQTALGNTDEQDGGTSTAEISGYLQSTNVRRGALGTDIPQESFTYQRQMANGFNRLLIATDTVYANTDGTGARTTSYGYQFAPGTLHVDSMTLTHPVVSASENGPGIAAFETTVYDSYGRAIWFKDAQGFITYTQYDDGTGAVTKSIQDVDTTRTGDFTNLPAGWTTPTGGGLHLITSYVVDGLGRTLQQTDPNGNVTFYRYNDADHEMRVYRGWHQNGAVWQTTGPVEITRTFRDGTPLDGVATGRVYTESLTVNIPSFSTSTPTGNETFDANDIQSLSRNITNISGQIVLTDEYFTIPSTYDQTDVQLGTASNDSSSGNYHETNLEYDGRGRLKRVLAPTGTITRYIYNAHDQVTQVWVGTNDTPASGYWSPDNNTGSANMGKIADYIYDYGAIGDGNLTDLVQHVSYIGTGTGTASDDRHTEYGYDWRDRLIATKLGAQATETTSDNSHPIIYLMLDNLGEVTSTQQYDGDTISIATDSNGDGIPDPPSSSLLRAQTTTDYDDRGRVYGSHVWDVDPVNGGTPTKKLDTNYWYDQRGNLIKTAAPGGLVTKTLYDGANRAITVYQTDGGGDTTWSDAGNVAGDDVLTQTESQLDGNGNIIFSITRERFHDAPESDTGDLGNPASTDPTAKARVYYVENYYDAANRLIGTANLGTNGGTVLSARPDGSLPVRSDTKLVTSYGYDAAGRLEDVTDPRGIVARTLYDALGRTSSTIADYTDGTPTSSTNQTTDFTYDGDDHVLTLKAILPAGLFQQTAYIYDAQTTLGSNINSNDILTGTQFPDPSTGQASAAQQELYTADAQGERITFKDRNGTTHTYARDVLGRLTGDAVTVANGNPWNIDTSITSLGYTFDSAGRPFQFTTYNSVGGVVNQVERIYNGLGQLTKESQEHDGAVAQNSPSVRYGYEMAGGANNSRLTQVVHPSGGDLNGQESYIYAAGLDDRISRVSEIDDGIPVVQPELLETYSYLGLNTVVIRTQGSGGAMLTYVKQSGDGADPSPTAGGDQYTGLDRFGRIADQRWISSGGSTIARFQYAYDRDGNVLYKNDLATPANSELYQTSGNIDPNAAYDGLNRLTNFVRGTLSDSNADGYMDTSTGTGAKTWTLDAAGNWTNVTGETGNRTNNAQNQATVVNGTTLVYDANGNLTVDQNGSAFTYDAWNHQITAAISGSKTVYVFDALGRRIRETPPNSALQRDLYFSAGGQVLEEHQNGGLLYTYHWTPDGTLMARDGSTDPAMGSMQLFVQEDANSNVIEITSTAKGVTQTWQYDPYGATSATNFNDMRFLFQQGRYDSGTGLYLFNSTGKGRNYYPNLGRWLQQDNGGYIDGPNLYQMETSGPVDRIDPAGLDVGYGAVGGGAGLDGMTAGSGGIALGLNGLPKGYGPVGDREDLSLYGNGNYHYQPPSVPSDASGWKEDDGSGNILMPGYEEEGDGSGMRGSPDDMILAAQSMLRQIEYDFWSAFGLAGPNQSDQMTKYLKCVENCINKHDPLNKLGKAGLTALGGTFPKSWVGATSAGVGGRTLGLTTVPSEVTNLLGGVRAVGHGLRDVGRAFSPFSNLYNWYLLGLEVGCAANCHCASGK